MNPTVRLLFSAYYWRHVFSPKKALTKFFAVIGIAGTGIEAVRKAYEQLNPGSTAITDFVTTNYVTLAVLTLLVALVVGVASAVPKISASSKVKQRDAVIGIEIGDLFATGDSIVIGTNCTFDTNTSDGLISAKSVQGQFTRRYYNEIHHLDGEVEAALGGQPYEELVGTRRGKRKRYAMGTTIRLKPAGREAFWVAISSMNEHGVAHASIEDVRAGLAGLWTFIAERGGGQPAVRMPVLGTGLGKIGATRTEMIKEILRSAVALCASGHYFERLTVVVPVKDYIAHRIDLDELERFLLYLTEFTEFRSSSNGGAGAVLASSSDAQGASDMRSSSPQAGQSASL